MTARAVFVAADGRLHVPWRMLLFLALAAAFLVPIGIAFSLAAALGSFNVTFGPMALGASGLQLSAALLAAHWAMLRIDHRSWASVCLDAGAARPAPMARGWLIGGATIGLPSLLLLALHWLDLRPAPDGPWWRAAASVSVALLPAALWEELLMRGYLFAALREWLGLVVATAVTSVAFGLMHLANPGAGAQSVVMVVLAGVFLAGVLAVTNSLYAAWMAHWAWNWVMAVPLHVAVSGVGMPRPDYELVDAGPDWATGGTWGPEGGAVAGISILLALALLYWMRRRTIGTGLHEDNA